MVVLAPSVGRAGSRSRGAANPAAQRSPQSTPQFPIPKLTDVTGLPNTMTSSVLTFCTVQAIDRGGVRQKITRRGGRSLPPADISKGFRQ